jgi:membrane-associated phospholipid phosphatase
MASYQIYKFGDVLLPVYEPDQNQTPGAVDSTLHVSMGGYFDTYGSETRRPTRRRLSVAGHYTGATSYEVDASGNQVVDHSGNYLIAGDATQVLRASLDALTAVVGVRDSLWRRRWDDTTVLQWVTARLLSLKLETDSKHRTINQPVEAIFETTMAAWRAETATTTAASLVADGWLGLTVEVDGNVEVEDGVLTITSSGTITDVQIGCAAQGIDLRWTGSLTLGRVLVIDAGAQTVTENGEDAYSGFSFGSGHSADGWLPLAVGANALAIWSDDAGSASFSHYEQWL